MMIRTHAVSTVIIVDCNLMVPLIIDSQIRVVSRLARIEFIILCGSYEFVDDITSSISIVVPGTNIGSMDSSSASEFWIQARVLIRN